MSMHQLFDVSVLFETSAAATTAYRKVFGAAPQDAPLGVQRPLAYRLFMPVTAEEYAGYRTLELEARRAWFQAQATSFAAIAARWP